MLKKISVQNARAGMYMHDIVGSWLQNPFWSTACTLKTASDVRKLQDSGIREIWIDTDRGVDVAEPAPAEADSEPDTDEAPPPAVISDTSTARSPGAKGARQSGFAEEAERAAQICARSKQAVTSMFQEARMGKAIDADGARDLVEDISGSVMRNPDALISLARLKTADEYTYMHSVAVCALMIALARQLALDEDSVREAGLAGLLHDMGKAFVPLEILNKPGKLTDEEFAIIKTHPAKGHEALLSGNVVGEVTLDVCLHHHEKTGGGGYPHNLSGDAISLFARMGAVCDVYDAITSNRPYKEGWNPAESLRRMAEWADGHFDQKVFQAFVRSIGIYPIGSFVQLRSGRLGVVIEQDSRSLLKPRVKAFYSTRQPGYIKPVIVELAHPASRDAIVGREEPSRWGIKNVDAWWSGTGTPG